jgi:hypothetical protein
MESKGGSMSGKKILSSLASIALIGAVNFFLFTALAENAVAQAAARPLRPEPCWQVAGVAKSALQERRAIAQQARQDIAKVCANSSLSPGQKRHEIQQIHQRERQQIEALITPAQQAAMRSCQQQRNPAHTGGGHVAGGHGSGPCGQTPSHNSNSNPEEETPPPGAH